jgi:hypothetical protein
LRTLRVASAKNRSRKELNSFAVASSLSTLGVALVLLAAKRQLFDMDVMCIYQRMRQCK